MDAARWERLQALFHAAADLPAADQHEFLAGECRDDPTLIPDALALLAEDARGGSLLDQGVGVVAQQMFRRASYTLPVDQFGPYRITRVLGEGGMGVVYLAERDDLGALAAIKILRDAWLSPARRDRFASEQRTLAQLNHPLIARLYDAGTLDDGTPWFVMEYVEGESLTAYCHTNHTSLRDRLRLFRDVCVAVQHAHQHLVIHRDLKPSNILVKADGSVKLLDFGIAKQLDSLDGPADQTRTGLRLMTPAYAAPEQLTGGRVGIHTDIYALGVILYELIVGRLPFDLAGKTSSEAETLIVGRDADRPSTVARDRSQSSAEWGDLDVLCLTAMHRDPERRYTTADALIRDVDHFLTGEPLEARPDTLRYRFGKFVRRHRAAVATSCVTFALIVGLVVFYTVRLTVARNEAVTEAARTQRIQRFTLDLFEGGDRAAGPADSLHVTTLVDRGLQQARTLDADPAIQAELYLTLGGIYQKLGNLTRADSLIRLSLERRRALFGATHRDVAASLVALGQLRIDQAQFEDAERLIRQGLDMAKHTLPSGDPGVVKATAALGRVLQERGQYDKAIPVLQDAVRLNEQASAGTADLAASMSALADAHYYSGHYETADSLNRRVLVMYRQVYGDRHPLVSDILINLGASQLDRGNYKEAEAFDRQALGITRAFYGDASYRTAANLTMLGRALVNENRLDEARTILEQALSIRERVYGPVHPSVASTANELGNILVLQGKYDQAEPYFRRMLSIYHQIYGDKHYLIGLATSNLATVYIDRKDYVHAEQLYREAIRRLTEAQGPDHMNTGIAHIKLGRALLRQARFAEAAVESRAGYDVLAKQASSGMSFLQNARKDLVTEFDSLKQPVRGAPFRAEFVAESTKAVAKP
jgi:eukaryotic-like serine/threonine-protein kinase